MKLKCPLCGNSESFLALESIEYMIGCNGKIEKAVTDSRKIQNLMSDLHVSRTR